MISFRLNETMTDSSNKTVTLNSPYLFIEKNASSMGSYDDGIYIYFGDKTPQHITVMMWTDDRDIETCDLRLTSINPNAS